MSTKASLIYDSAKGFHFYQELLDNTVHIEIETSSILVDAEIMPFEQWVGLGLPPNNPKNIQTELQQLRADLAAAVEVLRPFADAWNEWIIEREKRDCIFENINKFVCAYYDRETNIYKQASVILARLEGGGK